MVILFLKSAACCWRAHYGTSPSTLVQQTHSESPKIPKCTKCTSLCKTGRRQNWNFFDWQLGVFRLLPKTNPNFSVRDPVLLIKVYISSLCNPIPPQYLWVPLPEFQSYFIYIFLTEAKFVQSMCWSLKSVKCWLSWKGNKDYWKLTKKISCQNG